MGSGQSMNHSPGDMMDHHQYPDMNMIFKGIPKMIQIEEGYPPAAPRYYYSSQYAPEPWDRPKHTYSPSIEEKKQLECRNSSPEFKGNGSVNYKPYTNESTEMSPENEKKTSLSNDMSHRGATTASVPKRSLDPVKLVVGDLPYVDSS
nr:hypothetical protein F46C8.3 - Caenorhabditis elegans [Caenorhabditis elegans]